MKNIKNPSQAARTLRLRFAPALIAFAMATGLIAGTAPTLAAANTVKLYALDCGTLDMFDTAAFSSSGQFDGQRATLANPCFLIRHPKGDLLWDTGLDQSLADKPDGDLAPWGHTKMATKLTDQLGQLGLAPADIEYLSLSHYHADHSGNTGLFSASTFLVNATEHAFMFSAEMRAAPEAFAPYALLETARTVTFETSHDVFGDGTAVIHSMPGHTPGHSVLLLRLENAGAVLLTGDLYIMSASRTLQAVPSFNSDKAATLRSMKQFEILADITKARVVIQHEESDFKSLPAFPAFLD